jgi:hypothetical protein
LPSANLDVRLTRSASSKPNDPLHNHSVYVREFGDCVEDLSMILSHTNLNDNEAPIPKHKTDRFIPMRKCNSSFSDKVVDVKDSEDKENVRGK